MSKPKVPATRAPKKAAEPPKSSFKLRKLALVVVVDEHDAKGEAQRFDIELGPYFAPNAAKMAELLDELPTLLAQLNDRGTLQPPAA